MARANYRINLRGTEKEHSQEAADLISHARALLKRGSCEDLLSAMTTAAEAHAHASYLSEGHLDWEAWKVQSAARDRFTASTCYAGKPLMPRLRRVAGLGSWADHYPQNRWVRLTKKDLAQHPDVLSEFYAMLESSYAPIGGHLTIKRPQDLISDPDFSLYYGIDLDGDGEADAFTIAKTSKWGDKSVAAGTDGGSEAKKSMLRFKTRQLHQRGYYAEVSGAMATALLRDPKLPIVKSTARVAEVLGKSVESAGCQSVAGREVCGWYVRTIGGKPTMKLLVGRPSKSAAKARKRTPRKRRSSRRTSA